ncbi:unnamed protein product [Caenorhabditis nigoni]
MVAVSYWFFSVYAISMMITMVLTNFFILYKYTRVNKTWRKLEYQLILLRVLFDAFNGMTGCIYLSISVVDLFYDLVSYNVSFMFGIMSFNLMEVRCYIAAIIAIERVLATTIPLKFYRYRSKISNVFIVCCVISLGITADVTLFGFCGYRFEPVPGCTNFNCATPVCFQRYTSVTRMLYTTTNFLFSIILCYKLFWLSLKNTKVAVDIKKANLICLTDGFSALVFELIPWCISYYGIIDTKVSSRSSNWSISLDGEGSGILYDVEIDEERSHISAVQGVQYNKE